MFSSTILRLWYPSLALSMHHLLDESNAPGYHDLGEPLAAVGALVHLFPAS